MSSLLQVIHNAVRGEGRPGPASALVDLDAARAAGFEKGYSAELQRWSTALGAPGISGNAVAMVKAMGVLKASPYMSGPSVAAFVLEHAIGHQGREAMADSYEQSRLAASAGEPGAAGIARSLGRPSQGRPLPPAADVFARRRAQVDQTETDPRTAARLDDEEAALVRAGRSATTNTLPDPAAVFASRRNHKG